MMKQGRIFILSGPSGAGKTTLYEKVLTDPAIAQQIAKTVSVTTRAPRPNEVNGVDYFFVSKKMFLYKKKAGHFLESQKVFDNYYGTTLMAVKDILRSGKHVLLCIDVKGANIVCKKIKDVVRIFVKTPTIKELEKRLKARGTEEAAVVKLRIDTARTELKEEKKYQYSVINDDFKKAYIELKQVLLAEMT